MVDNLRYLIIILSFYLILLPGSFAQDQYVSEKLSENIYKITSGNSNSVLFVGNNSSVLINSEHFFYSEDIKDFINQITDKPVKFIISSHYHGHIENELFSVGDEETTLIIHENSLNRLLKSEQEGNTKLYRTISFKDRLDFKIDDEEINIIHFPKAHTDGDLAVYFKNSNVLFTGNLFYSNSYPFIDVLSGGTVRGYIDASNGLLKISNKKTILVPGNGKASNEKVLGNFKKMVINSKNRVQLQIHAEKQLKIILNERPLADFDADRWGRGLIKSHEFVKNLYRALSVNN
ncbi:MAG: hypothetical protein GTO02_14090 [Candidatus Dadabacteria bacterium]|nr:hypothetical protein [Candidatus Dadabacteria bacterium]NIQ15478.1 hypothetical protein [Candidatus Dadabacteria bacterium]